MEKEGNDNKTGKSFTLAKMLEAENDAAGKITRCYRKFDLGLIYLWEKTLLYIFYNTYRCP